MGVRDGFAFTLLMMRTGAALLLTLGIVAFLFVVYLRGGLGELGQAFGVLQGVLLSTMAYLFTLHAADRAEATVLSERRKRGRLEGKAREEAAEAEVVRAELDLARRVLERLEKDPAVGRRVKEVERQVATEDEE